MTGTIVPTDQELFPNRIRWTVDDCARLVQAGSISGRYELIDGEIMSKMGQKPLHTSTLILVAQVLASIYGFLRVRQQSPVRIPGELGRYSEPEPDVCVTLNEITDYVAAQPEAGDVVLAVEISDSSLNFDTGIKATLYAQAEIAEYWVVDPTNRRVHVLRRPSAGRYTDICVIGEEGEIAAPGTAGAHVSVAAILPPAKVN